MKNDKKLQRIVVEINTKDYFESASIAQKCFLIAEKLNHHPKLIVEYNLVRIELTTHDSGNTVTEKDHEFVTLLKSKIGA